MGAAAVVERNRRSLRIGGTAYPVLLPSVRDPRLHLAAVIVSLQVLGQVSFGFDLSIAQILVSLITCAVLEVAIAFRRQRVILWPASALLTGNGVAFVLRVPGTEHGDWWSMHGAWIFAGTAAAGLLSKHVIRVRGNHVFNPSNFGLVLCFLTLGPARAEPLDFWWGPLTPALALALAIIVAGGLVILRRLSLLGIALGFWLSFVLGIGVVAASGHAMSARWHVGPVSDGFFWWILAFSPEVLVFLFFMLTDPRTVPTSRGARVAYGVAVGLLATLLIAPQTTEFASKVALLAALTIVCGARALWMLAGPAARSRLAPTPALLRERRPASVAAAGAGMLAFACGFAALLVVAGSPARPEDAAAARPSPPRQLTVTVADTEGVARLGRAAAARIAQDAVRALGIEARALRTRDEGTATKGADGRRLAGIWQRIRRAGGGQLEVAEYDVRAVRIALRRAEGQGQPRILATLRGTVSVATYDAKRTSPLRRTDPAAVSRTVEVALLHGRYVIVAPRDDPTVRTGTSDHHSVAATGRQLGGARLTEVAGRTGLDFTNGAFAFGVSSDPAPMMGGGVCWLDYDHDGWIDLYLVNTHAVADAGRFENRGGLPRSALYRNVRGRFVDVSQRAGVDLPVRGTGCVAADLNGDGRTDIYVTTAGYDVETDGYDALLWNNGDGTFAMGAQAAGIGAPGWHAGAAVGDVNGDRLPDLFVAGYTDPNAPLPGSAAGFPNDHRGVADHLYLNLGNDGAGHARFRDVSRAVGLARGRPQHGLGAAFSDVDGDGRLDLYVANDGDPNRLYLNVATHEGAGGGTGLGFEFEERGRQAGVADGNAGMGVSTSDFTGDGRPDLFVTNSRRQLHAAFTGGKAGASFADARRVFADAIGAGPTGWGVGWPDLDLDGYPDLVIANGAIPVRDPTRDAQRVQVLHNLGSGFADAAGALGPRGGPRLNARGLAVADFDNDGDPDVAINSVGGHASLFRNDGAHGHWLRVVVEPFAAGASVSAVLPDGRVLVRELQAGDSYLSTSDPRVLFGLGDATVVRELVVHRPDGSVSRRANVQADTMVTVRG